MKAKTQKALAEALGCTKGNISKLLRAGKIPPRPPGGWDVEKIRKLVPETGKGKGRGRPRKGKPVDPKPSKVPEPSGADLARALSEVKGLEDLEELSLQTVQRALLDSPPHIAGPLAMKILEQLDKRRGVTESDPLVKLEQVWVLIAKRAGAERQAGVRHHIALSVVGPDRLPDWRYLSTKPAYLGGIQP